MIINKHYLHRYIKLIQIAKTSNFNTKSIEKHHIIPHCMGGTNEPPNLIILSTRFHFIAHYLLFKAFPNNISLHHAFSMMICNNLYTSRKMTSWMYALAKAVRSDSLKGKPRPEWVKEKLRKPKSNTDNYHKPKSPEHKEKISKSHLGQPKSKESIRKSVLGKQKYWENIKKINFERDESIRKSFLERNECREKFYEFASNEFGVSNSVLKKALTNIKLKPYQA